LDDIGTEDIAVSFGNKRAAFSEIMDAAEKKGKLVIITTNLQKEEIVQRYKERVYDRIISTTKRIKFSGNSLRS
jgi:DNA replication protein DnaC